MSLCRAHSSLTMEQTWTAARPSWATLQELEASRATGTAMVPGSVWTPLLVPSGSSMLSTTNLSGDSTLALDLMGEHLANGHIGAAGTMCLCNGVLAGTLMELFSSLMALTVGWDKSEIIPYNCFSISSSDCGPPVAAGWTPIEDAVLNMFQYLHLLQATDAVPSHPTVRSQSSNGCACALPPVAGTSLWIRVLCVLSA